MPDKTSPARSIQRSWKGNSPTLPAPTAAAMPRTTRQLMDIPSSKSLEGFTTADTAIDIVGIGDENNPSSISEDGQADF